MRNAPSTALRRYLATLLILCLVAVALPQAGDAQPSPSENRSDAARRVLALEDRISGERETLGALDQRLAAMEQQLFQKRTEWSDARAGLRSARSRYSRRMVSMYKSGGLDPLEMIVGSSSLADLFRRSSLIARLAEKDRVSLLQARQAEADVAYHAQVLSEMSSQLESMRTQRTQGIARLQKALAEQRRLLAQLESPERSAVTGVVRRRSKSRSAAQSRWRGSSVPLGSSVWLAEARLVPYSATYLVPSHQPRTYRTAGGTYTAVCSWYGNQFHGRRTASGQIFNQNDFTCASRTLPFGTRLALTRGSRRIIVVVNDRGPFIAGRDLDLSKAAAAALGFSGVASVTAQKVAADR